MAKKISSPNDSLQQQSTTHPSTRSGDRSSLDATSFASSRRPLAGSSQIGGGSYKTYMLDHLERMHSDIEATTRKSELEQRRLYKLDKDLQTEEANFVQKRQKYKLHQNAQEDNVQHKAVAVKQLEKRLAKAIMDLNRGTHENEQMQEQIDQLRKERQILDTVFKQLDRGIKNNGRTMERLKVTISEEKQSSEEAKQKSGALNKMLDRERRNFQAHTEKLRETVRKENDVQKEQERPMAPERSEKGASRGRSKGARSYMVADEEEAFSETSMHRRILKLSFLNTIQRRHIRQHQKNIEVFEQAFATIKSSTGISDIEEIVKIFILLEQRNFSLLTYVNQLNQEIESVGTRNRELQSQLGSHQHEEKQCAAQKETALSDINTLITKTKLATKEQEKMIEDVTAAHDECRPLLWKIVEFLKQEIPNLVNMGYEGDIPPMKLPPQDDQAENLNHYLTYIEEAVLQFRVCLQPDVLLHYQLPQPTERVRQQEKDTKPRDLPCAHIAGDDSDDDPETGIAEKPWTRSELREKAQQMIQRRRKKPGQAVKMGDHSQERRTDPDPDAAANETAAGGRPRVVSDMGAGPPPPPKEYAASSVASKESAGDSGASGTSGALSKSPTMSSKKQTSGDLKEQMGEEESPGGKPHRDEMWWRNQGKEKKK